MGRLADRIARLREAGHLLRSHAAGPASARALIACYASLLHSTTDRTEVSLVLKIGGRQFPFTMRKSDIFTLGEIFHERQYALATPLPARPLIVDAGANIGAAAVWLLGTYDASRLIAFEPASDNFRFLSANLGSRANVTLVRAALGARDGTVRLGLADHGAEHAVVNDAREKAEDVPSYALGPWLTREGTRGVDLLKLDVEGSELLVLEGLGERLADIRVIVAEVHERLVDASVFYDTVMRAGFTVVRKQRYRGGEEQGVHTVELARI